MKLENIHPGEILLKEFLEPMSISQNKLAVNIKVSPRRINEICLHKRAISVDTAIRLAKFFNTTVSFWLNLQNMYDTEELQTSNPNQYSGIGNYLSCITPSSNNIRSQA